MTNKHGKSQTNKKCDIFQKFSDTIQRGWTIRHIVFIFALAKQLVIFSFSNLFIFLFPCDCLKLQQY